MMKRFLTAKEAANYLGIAESELNKLVSAHQIPIYKIGGIYTRFKVDDLEAHRKKGVTKGDKDNHRNVLDAIRDFFYFNDFYIYCSVAIVIILYFIFAR